MNIEQAKELQSNLLWRSIVEELDKKVGFELLKLRSCTPEQLPLIQAKVECYESLTRLPADVIDRES